MIRNIFYDLAILMQHNIQVHALKFRNFFQSVISFHGFLSANNLGVIQITLISLLQRKFDA